MIESCNKLRGSEAGNHDLRIPEGNDLEQVYDIMTVDDDGFLNYDEFQVLVFKATLENYGEE